jgi:hypothetical protein
VEFIGEELRPGDRENFVETWIVSFRSGSGRKMEKGKLLKRLIARAEGTEWDSGEIRPSVDEEEPETEIGTSDF